MREFQVGQRVTIGGESCTIRFIGTIPQWPEDVAVGVEWDNKLKGKNDGQLQNIRYFHTIKGLKTGSFLKERKLNRDAQRGRFFFKSLVNKYADFSVHDRDIETIKFGSKNVQSYGFDNLMHSNSDLEGLKIASLTKESIIDCELSMGSTRSVSDLYNYDYGLEKYIQLSLSNSQMKSMRLPLLANLDISSNLFSSTHQIFKIMLNLPNLETLNLSNNNFVSDDTFFGHLILNHSLSKNFGQDSLKHAKGMFSNLRKIKISSNYLRKSTLMIVLLLFDNLEDLNLSDNLIDDEWFLCDYTSVIETDKHIEIQEIMQEVNYIFKDCLQVTHLSTGKYEIKVQFLKFLTISDNIKRITSLNLSFNKLTSIPWILIDVFRNGGLMELNLSNNQIHLLTQDDANLTNIPVSSQLLNINSLTKQYQPSSLIETHSEALKYNDLSLDWKWFKLSRLNLNCNQFTTFQELDIINLKFPNLKQLQINDNNKIWNKPEELEEYTAKFNKIKSRDPTAFGDGTLEDFIIEEIFVSVVYRFNDSLEYLNKSKILLDERKNSELYFVAKLKEGCFNDCHSSEARRFIFSNFGTKRLDILCDRYNVDIIELRKDIDCLTSNKLIDHRKPNTIKYNLIDITLRFHDATINDSKKMKKPTSHSSNEIKHTFFNTMTILQFKGIIKRLFDVYSVLELRIFFTLSFEEYYGKNNDEEVIYKTEELVNNEDELYQYGFKNGDVIDVYHNTEIFA
ncbi:Pac2 protein [Saccharomycopsis crataegensis]|uniref:Pac2 protein n=1 Tax=Saccharomycopsis crataegensis TaxID=43959 RepID=A0AAV5QUL2_9ASCO|nr:Pac2 protein [Saccharomycopsis crataegensis]